MLVIDYSQQAIKPRKAIVLIPGFKYFGLTNFILDKLQNKPKALQDYQEIKKDNLPIKQLELEQCLFDIYEVDWREEIPPVTSNNF